MQRIGQRPKELALERRWFCHRCTLRGVTRWRGTELEEGLPVRKSRGTVDGAQARRTQAAKRTGGQLCTGTTADDRGAARLACEAWSPS